MAEVLAVKRPAGGAYGQWMNANRASLTEQAAKDGLTGVTAAAKKGSEVWKAMSDADKVPWEKKFKEAQAAYEAYKNSDGFVAPEKKQKRGKKDEKKKKKDPEAPKKPVGGAFGMFSNEKRPEFTKLAEAKGEKGFGPVAKMTSEAFKALSEEQKKPYEEQFNKAMGEYKVAMASYKEKKAAEAPVEDEASAPAPKKEKTPAKKEAKAKATPGKKEAKAKATPAKKEAKAKAKASGKKRAGGEVAGAPPAKSGRGAAKAKGKAKGKAGGDVDHGLPEKVLAAADKEGFRAALVNLAKRADIKAKGCDPTKMLAALRSADGLVNKAKTALLAA